MLKLNNTFLLTNQIDKVPSGGRELLCKLNHDILKEIYGDKCTVFELPKNLVRNISMLLNHYEISLKKIGNHQESFMTL